MDKKERDEIIAFFWCDRHQTMHFITEHLECKCSDKYVEGIRRKSMNIEKVYKGKRLNADSLRNEQLENKPVTIKDIEMEKFGEQDKVVLSFKETKLTLVLNVTNANFLKKKFGTETDEWIGKKIKLWIKDDVEYAGELMEGIRMKI